MRYIEAIRGGYNSRPEEERQSLVRLLVRDTRLFLRGGPHTARVSGAVFDDEKTAYSCGFDSTVRAWDLEHGVCSHTIVCFISVYW